MLPSPRRLARCLALLAGFALFGCSSSSNSSLPHAGASFGSGALALTSAETSRAVTINPGAATTAWTIVSTDTWLTATPAAGVGPATVTLTVNRTGLPAGSYTGAVQLVTTNGSPLLPVSIQVTSSQTGAAQLTVAPTSLDFGSSQTTATFTITGTGATPLSWSAGELVSWAALSARRGTGDATITVTVNRNTLAAGTHTGAIRVTSNGGTATVGLSLTVGASSSTTTTPTLTASPSAVAFGSTDSSTSVALHASGTAVTWTATASAGWVSVSPASGNGDGSLTIGIDRSQLGLGLNSANVAVAYSIGGQATGTLNIPVSVVIGGNGTQPQLAVAPSALTFAGTATSATLDLTNLGAAGLTWTASPSASWLSVSPGTGTDAATLTVTIDRTDPASAQGGVVTITSNGGTASVPVSIATPSGSSPLLQPVLHVQPGLLDFGQSATQLPLVVTNQGGGSLNWTATTQQSWITITPNAGLNGGTAQVRINRAAMAAGTNLGSITFTSQGGNATVLVSAVQPGGSQPTQLLVNPTGLDFGLTLNQLTVNIANTGGGTLNWTITSSQPFVTVAPASGTGNASVTVGVDRSALTPGTHTANLNVTSNGGNAVVTVSVSK